MIRRTASALIAALLISVAFNAAVAATRSPALQSKLNQVTNSTSVGLVIVAFNTNSGLNALANLSNTTPNMQWFMSSNFQLPTDPAAPATTLYVSAAVSATGTPAFKYEPYRYRL